MSQRRLTPQRTTIRGGDIVLDDRGLNRVMEMYCDGLGIDRDSVRTVAFDELLTAHLEQAGITSETLKEFGDPVARLAAVIRNKQTMANRWQQTNKQTGEQNESGAPIYATTSSTTVENLVGIIKERLSGQTPCIPDQSTKTARDILGEWLNIQIKPNVELHMVTGHVIKLAKLSQAKIIERCAGTPMSGCLTGKGEITAARARAFINAVESAMKEGDYNGARMDVIRATAKTSHYAVSQPYVGR